MHKKKPIIIKYMIPAALILIYAVFVILLYAAHKETGCDIADIEPDIEYMNIHKTGGIAGVRRDRRVYRDGDRYFLDFTEDAGSMFEITKAEYLLCTDIDPDYLEKQVEPLASDMFYYEITLRKNGEETILPRKAYYHNSLGFSSFVHDNKFMETEDKVDYDTCIALASYLYTHGIKYSCLSYPTGSDIYFHGFVIENTSPIDLNYKEEYGKLSSESSHILNKPEEYKDLIKQCKIIDFYGEKAYFNTVTTEHLTGFYIVCPAYEDSICFYSEKPRNMSVGRFNYDLMCIICGTDNSKYDIYVFIAGTAVFLTLFIISVIFGKIYKSKQKISSDGE